MRSRIDPGPLGVGLLCAALRSVCAGFVRAGFAYSGFVCAGLVCAGIGGCASATDPPVVAVGGPTDTEGRASTDGASGTPVKRNVDTRVGSSTGFKLSTGYSDKPRPEFDSVCGAAGSDPQNPTGDAKLCGTRGRVSVEYSQHPLRGDAPCELVSLSHAPKEAFTPEMASACVVGDELVATETCMMCRMPDTGWAMHARISEMTEEQARDAFTRMNLQGSVPTDADGWQAAIERGEAPPAPNPNQ